MFLAFLIQRMVWVIPEAETHTMTSWGKALFNSMKGNKILDPYPYRLHNLTDYFYASTTSDWHAEA